MRRRLLPLVLLAAGCATAGRRPAASAAAAASTGARAQQPEMPPAMRALFEREAAPLAPHAFSSPAGIHGSVESKTAPKVTPGDGAESLTVDLGTSQPLVCALHADRIDAAGSYDGFLRQITDAAKIDVVSARLARIDVVQGSPLLGFEVLYTAARQDGQKLGGLVKVAIYPNDVHSLLCFHDEPGYAATFHRIVKGLAASLRRTGAKNPHDTAQFAEVQVVRLKDLPVGFEEHHLTKQRDGTTTWVSVSAEIVPRSPKDLATEDSYHVETVAADGTILEEISVHTSGGELERQLKLSRQEGTTTYAWSGTISGKKVDGSFPTKAGLASDALVARRYARGAKPAAELRFEQWAPAIDPAKPTELVVRTVAAKPGRLAIEAGPVKLTSDVDEHGWPRYSEMPIGPAVLVSERAWSRGRP